MNFFLRFFFDLLDVFDKSLISISSTGALLATFFSSSKVFAFLAINEELWAISFISIYGSFLSNSSSFAIRSVITELKKSG